MDHLITVDVDQMYGIEIEEWPARIAEVAMWLMDHQMNLRFSEAFGQYFVRLPLKKSPHIHQANALATEWTSVLPSAECDYVLGNPPFLGKKEQTSQQKAEVLATWNNAKGCGNLDYVTCWYAKALDYISGTDIAVAFVSTNSITQGEQVGIFWDAMAKRFTPEIRFAHRTFSWESEARGKAHVHKELEFSAAPLGLTLEPMEDAHYLVKDGESTFQLAEIGVMTKSINDLPRVKQGSEDVWRLLTFAAGGLACLALLLFVNS